MSLNIKMNSLQLETLCEDIMDSYPYDSLEDVREVLKNARQGVYGFGHESRGAITMILIRDWMSQHLEKKARILESKHNKQKLSDKTIYKTVDYEKFKKNPPVNLKKKQDEKEKAYQKFKQDLYKNKLMK